MSVIVLRSRQKTYSACLIFFVILQFKCEDLPGDHGRISWIDSTPTAPLVLGAVVSLAQHCCWPAVGTTAPLRGVPAVVVGVVEEVGPTFASSQVVVAHFPTPPGFLHMRKDDI